MIGRLQLTSSQALTALLEALLLEAKNWG